ncbi:MAG: tetratricopeptide repeat protein [Caulobacteraceae bacterium]
MRIGLRHAIAAALTLALLSTGPARADGITDGNEGREALLAGNLDEAIRLFTHAIAFGALTAKNQAITLNLRANAYLEKGQTEVALDDINESLRLTETPDAHFTRSKIYIAQFRYDDAVEELNKTMQMGSQAADVWALRGHAQLYAGRLNEAVKDLDQSIKLVSDYGFAWKTRGHAYMNMGQDDKAIADETKAIAIDGKDVEAHWLRAYAYRYRKKDLPKALADYTAALSADPADSSARTGRADTYEEMGRFAEAQGDYDEWIKQNPRGPFGYWARGRLNLVQGKAGAAADLAKAVSLKPTDPYNVLWLHLARTKEGANDTAELQANAAKPNRAIWPGPLLDYFTGKADAATVLSKAGQGEGKAKATQLCEANLFLGQDDLAKGRKSEGLEKLQTAAKTCDGTSREARLTRAELQRSGVTAPKPVLTQASSTGVKTVPMPAGPTVKPVKPKVPAQVQAQASTQGGGDFSLRGSLK